MLYFNFLLEVEENASNLYKANIIINFSLQIVLSAVKSPDLSQIQVFYIANHELFPDDFGTFLIHKKMHLNSNRGIRELNF